MGIGPLLTLVWASGHAVLNSILISNKKIVPFGKILYITLLAQIPLHGIFYYKLGYSVSNIYVICVILLSILFSYNIKIK